MEGLYTNCETRESKGYTVMKQVIRGEKMERMITYNRTKKSYKKITITSLWNEKGVALVMVLIISAISLAMMAGLLYMITSGTQISGLERRYKIAREAGIGGGGIAYEIIDSRIVTAASLATEFSYLSTFTVTATDACLNAKLLTKTIDWPITCDKSVSINPSTSTTYDMSFILGGYTIYGKIVDTVLGNTSGDGDLIRSGVVTTENASVQKMPYFYTVEVAAQSTNSPSERAKLSILYQY